MISTAVLIVSTFSFVFAAVALVTSVRRQKRNRELMEFMLNRIEELDALASAGEERLESATQKCAEKANRITWLENKVGELKSQKRNDFEDSVFTEWDDAQRAVTLREKRRRVISLADAGESTEEIAEHLGMLAGEVDLIINLSRAEVTQIN